MTEAARRSSAWSFPLVLGLVLSVLLIGGGLLWFQFLRDTELVDWTIATGNSKGVYFKLGKGLEHIFKRHPSIRITAAETAGSRQNMAMLERGEVQLAMVQDDTPGTSRTRTVSLLHRELLHVLVRRGLERTVTDIGDLRGLRVVLGERGSGTAAVAADVLEHFDIETDALRPEFAEPGEVVERLGKKTIDAAFILSALPSSVADEACSSGLATLLSIGHGQRGETAADGIAAADPRFSKATIPARTYGTFPAAPAHTISVNAVLVAAEDLDASLVQELTAQLFANRIALAKSHPVALHLREKYEPWTLRYPAHDGAVAFYTRDTPPFIVQYAEAIALIITLLVGVVSGFATIRKLAARSRKELIDYYYKEIALIVSKTPEGGLDESRRRLIELRNRAFQHLVDEKLAPDESFTIFQDFLRAELTGIESQLGKT